MTPRVSSRSRSCPLRINLEILIKSIVDGAWQEVTSRVDGKHPNIAVTQGGNLILAYSANGQIYVAQQNGFAWSEIGVGSTTGGGISSTGRWSLNPRLMLDANDQPIVAWVDGLAGREHVFIRRFDGTSWIPFGEVIDASSTF